MALSWRLGRARLVEGAVSASIAPQGTTGVRRLLASFFGPALSMSKHDFPEAVSIRRELEMIGATAEDT